jgi:CheY-like chemotaxis protein
MERSDSDEGRSGQAGSVSPGRTPSPALLGVADGGFDLVGYLEIVLAVGAAGGGLVRLAVPGPLPSSYWLAGVQLGGAALLLLSRYTLSYAQRRYAPLLLLALFSLGGVLVYGSTLVPGVALAITAAVAALLFGYRGALASVVVAALVMAAGAFYFVVLEAPYPALPSPAGPGQWAVQWLLVIAFTFLAAVGNNAIVVALRGIRLRREQTLAELAQEVADHAVLARVTEQLAPRVEAGRAAAGVAHDLQNMLQVVIANAQLLREGQTAPASMASLEALAHETSGWLKGLLAVGRTGRGRPLDAEALRRFCGTLERAVPHTLDLRLTSTTTRRIQHPEAKWTATLLGLLLDGLDVAEGGGRLELVFEGLDDGPRAGGVVLTLRRFYPAHRQSIIPQMREALSLGLEAAVRSVEREGGHVAVGPRTAAFRQIVLELPLSPVERSRSGLRSSAYAWASGELPRVLVVEPEAPGPVVRVLRAQGLEVVEAATAEAALAALRPGAPFDAVVLDIAVTRDVEPLLAAHRPGVLLALVDARRTLPEEVEQLVKPVTSRTLLAALSLLLKGRRERVA